MAYLCMGIYVLFRRWTAPKATHFYVFCLVSFVLYSFRYTGEFDTFDWVIYWANVAASGIQPALFLHFAVSFSGAFNAEQRKRVRNRLLIMLIYLPGIFLIALQCTAINLWSATELLRHRLDQIAVGYLAVYYIIAAIVFRRHYRKAESALERQQLKWLTRGTLLATVPFTLFYVAPYLLDLNVSSLLTKVGRAIPGVPALTCRLGHRALPADGRRSHLQARCGLYAGHRGLGGCVLRGHCIYRGARSYQSAKPGHIRPAGWRHDHRRRF